MREGTAGEAATPGHLEGHLTQSQCVLRSISLLTLTEPLELQVSKLSKGEEAEVLSSTSLHTAGTSACCSSEPCPHLQLLFPVYAGFLFCIYNVVTPQPCLVTKPTAIILLPHVVPSVWCINMHVCMSHVVSIIQVSFFFILYAFSEAFTFPGKSTSLNWSAWSCYMKDNKSIIEISALLLENFGLLSRKL